MTSKEIEQLLEKSDKQLIGKPYVGNELEEKVVSNIIKIAQRKIKKFTTYKKYGKNILLIHSEERVTLDHNFVINKLKEYFSNISMQFDCIVLKLSLKFHFFSRDEYFFCNIKI